MLSRASVLNLELHKKHSYASPFHERSVAHITLDGGRLEVAQRPGEQAVGVRDVVSLVRADDEAVEFLACHAGRAGPRFDVKHKRTVRDEGAFAAATWAPHGGWLMYFRAQVMAQVGRALEGPLAISAVVLVAIVFLERQTLIICVCGGARMKRSLDVFALRCHVRRADIQFEEEHNWRRER